MSQNAKLELDAVAVVGDVVELAKAKV